MQQIVKCRLYDNTNDFPLENIYLSCICNDNVKRYCPINKVNEDFDSGIRIQDIYGDIYQLCLAKQENINSKYFPNGDLLIPLTTIENLYDTFKSIFGTVRVKFLKEDNAIKFYPPKDISGISKIFAIGLNIKFTNEDNQNITTYANGLIETSTGGTNNFTAKSMLVKLINSQPVIISFKNNISTVSYNENAIVKNTLVIGKTVESLNEYADSYYPLVLANKWYLYENHIIKPINVHNPMLAYFRSNYLLYKNSTYKYNYFEMNKLILNEGRK